MIHNLQGQIEYHKKLEKIRPKGCRKEIKINFEHTEQTKLIDRKLRENKQDRS